MRLSILPVQSVGERLELDKINFELAGLGIELLCHSVERHINLDPGQQHTITIKASTETGIPIEGRYMLWGDIDLLVETAGETSPWFPAGLVEELEELLGRRVDVVTTNGLYWLLRRRILREARPL